MFEHTQSGHPAATGTSRTPPASFPAPPPLPGLRAEWRRLARRLADPDIELTSDVVAALLTTHQRLTAAGGVVDAMADALVRQLGYQMADAEACIDG